MNNQNNQIQANIDEIVQHLTAQIAQLSSDNAVLKSLVSQYQQALEKAEQQTEKVENAE